MDIEQAFADAQKRLRNASAQAYAADNRRMAQSFVQATHRLNEAEHELQWPAMGYFLQWFFYPYGSRRAASDNTPHDQKTYISSLPIEHQGMAGQWVDFKWKRE